VAPLYDNPVSTFLASIAVRATTAPAGSETVPVIVPRSLWENPAEAIRKNPNTTASLFITDTPLYWNSFQGHYRNLDIESSGFFLDVFLGVFYLSTGSDVIK
jgi:hypothetical protein